jgi:aldehyde dehydrogenase (NAD+)
MRAGARDLHVVTSRRMSELHAILGRLGLDFAAGTPLPGAARDRFLPASPEVVTTEDPSTGAPLADVALASSADYDALVDAARAAFPAWRDTPAPKRGALVRRLGELFREHKADLGELISLEVGKIRSEGSGEVQEMIDVCELAVGSERQLTGLTIASERPSHRMIEQWHPLGPAPIVTAFNFPMAVWAWNAALALVCGDVTCGSPRRSRRCARPLLQGLCQQARWRRMSARAGCSGWRWGARSCRGRMAEDRRFPLVSFTGSDRGGAARWRRSVAGRLGRSILELGGNNGVMVLDDANLELAVRAIVFGAVGTAGQRCTTTRRRVRAARGGGGAAGQAEARRTRTVSSGDPLAPPGCSSGRSCRPRAVRAFEQAVAGGGAGGEDRHGRQGVSGPRVFRGADDRAARGATIAVRGGVGRDVRADPVCVPVDEPTTRPSEWHNAVKARAVERDLHGEPAARGAVPQSAEGRTAGSRT